MIQMAFVVLKYWFTLSGAPQNPYRDSEKNKHDKSLKLSENLSLLISFSAQTMIDSNTILFDWYGVTIWTPLAINDKSVKPSTADSVPLRISPDPQLTSKSSFILLVNSM